MTYSLPHSRKIRPLCASFAFLIPLVWAQGQRGIDFAALIRTPADIQATLERCDGHPEFETALANWLERAQPRSPAEGAAIRETSLRLLEDTTDRQIMFALIDGLLRHALEDVKSDAGIVPRQLAVTLYLDIAKAVRQKFKVKESAVLAEGLAEGVTNERQAGFVKEFLNIAEPRAPRVPATNAPSVTSAKTTASSP